MRRKTSVLPQLLIISLMLVAGMLWSSPTFRGWWHSEAETANAEFAWTELKEADLTETNLVFVTITTDTIYGVDSTVVWTAFSGTQDLQWVHAFAPTVSGGDSATISDVKCYLTNDTGVLASRSWWHFSSIATNVDADTSITFTPPMAAGIRFAIYSSADQDTTIVGGFYIYR